MYRHSPPSRPLSALLAVGALLVAGCSTSGGGSEGGGSTTAGGDKTTSTSGGEDTSTSGSDETTTTTEPVDGPTTGDLEGILPAATDIGSGWTEDNSPDDNQNTSFEDECPEVADLGLGDDNESDKVERKFADRRERQLQVTLSPSAEALDDEQLTAFIDAVNGCGTITDTDDQGLTTSFDLEAQADNDYGEQGIRLQAEVTLSGGVLPEDLTLTLYALLWREGTVGVQLIALDGINDATFETVPFDTDVLVGLADDVDAQVKDLVG